MSEQPTKTVEVVFPQHVNHYGSLFGGEALRMMDTVAFVAATRYTRRTMVTKAVTDVEYRAPVHHGEIAEMTAAVVEVGRTSVAVEVEMTAEVLLSGERRSCGSGRFTFVAIDEDETAVTVR